MQGPTPQSKHMILPFVTTYYSNFDNQHTIMTCNNLLTKSNNAHVKEVFGDSKIVLAFKQPPNLLRHLTRVKFNPSELHTTKENGLFKCNDSRCKICAIYIQPCKSFITANGTEWHIKNTITCKSKNVVYYLNCLQRSYDIYRKNKRFPQTYEQSYLQLSFGNLSRSF